MFADGSRAVDNGNGSSPNDDISQAKIIAVMGMTGSGKSTFIQKLTGTTEVTVGDGLHSCELVSLCT